MQKKINNLKKQLKHSESKTLSGRINFSSVLRLNKFKKRNLFLSKRKKYNKFKR